MKKDWNSMLTPLTKRMTRWEKFSRMLFRVQYLIDVRNLFNNKFFCFQLLLCYDGSSSVGFTAPFCLGKQHTRLISENYIYVNFKLFG